MGFITKQELQKIILEAVDIAFEKKFAQKDVTYFQDGVITADNGDGSYGVKINGIVSVLRSRGIDQLTVGDVVRVIVPNSNARDRFIDSKRV